MPFLQDIIHKLEEGGGLRYVRIGVSILAVVGVAAAYNWRGYRNLASMDAMDSAQVARNIAEGKGFTTLFVRPLSIYLVKHRRQQKLGPAASGDPAQLREMHPDLANPPVYPLVLSGLMKALPRFFHPTGSAYWGRLWFKADFLISVFNQALFLALVVTVFFWARNLFDPGLAWLSALLMLGTELFWRFSVSGLSTILLMLIFMGLVWCLTLIDKEATEPKLGTNAMLVLAAFAGAIVAVGGLTRYSFGWLILPTLLFVILFGGPKRIPLAFIALFVFTCLMLPWMLRNYKIGGTPFGTAQYSVLEATVMFPEHRLERTLQPDFTTVFIGGLWRKLVVNCREIVHSELPRLGGTWLSAFFLAGLLVPFRKPALSRLRYFLLSSIFVLVLVQAMGRTQLSEDSPEINSENLLVLTAPLVLVYGVSLFFLLLDQLVLPAREWRYAIIGVFCVAVCLPMPLALLPPRPQLVSYPPYDPPHIQTLATWVREHELIMTDIPWAVAWYGQRQSVWLTLSAIPDPKDTVNHEDFFVINDYLKPINLLYLTPVSTDAKFLSQWVHGGVGRGWGNFTLECLMRGTVPEGFPLVKAWKWWWPDQLVLSDWARWGKEQ